MSSNRSNIELIANFILDEIRKNPGKTLKELHAFLQQNENLPIVSLQILGKYLHVLHKQGYVKRTITHPHRYKLGKTPSPFKPKPFQKKEQQNVHDQKISLQNSLKKPKQPVADRRQSVTMDVYRENREKVVETRANLILAAIRKYPNRTQKRLLTILKLNNKEFRTLKSQMFRNYITTLQQRGYIKREGKRFSKYTVVNDAPFTYVSVSIYNHRKQG